MTEYRTRHLQFIKLVLYRMSYHINYDICYPLTWRPSPGSYSFEVQNAKPSLHFRLLSPTVRYFSTPGCLGNLSPMIIEFSPCFARLEQNSYSLLISFRMLVQPDFCHHSSLFEGSLPLARGLPSYPFQRSTLILMLKSNLA